MIGYLGDFAEDATVKFAWSSNAAAGASITRATDGTIKVWSLATGADVTNGAVTDTEDGIDTGIHIVSINTAAHADYAVGADYAVWVDGAVIDGQTVNGLLASFSIENRTVKALKAGIIANATFAADVGSTAYATNIIALAVRKVLDELNLDHLMKIAVADRTNMTAEVVDDTVLANIMTKTDGDTSDYAIATDSLEALHDKIDTRATPGAF